VQRLGQLPCAKGMQSLAPAGEPLVGAAGVFRGAGARVGTSVTRLAMRRLARSGHAMSVSNERQNLFCQPVSNDWLGVAEEGSVGHQR
jgi:hypothetical protein